MCLKNTPRRWLDAADPCRIQHDALRLCPAREPGQRCRVSQQGWSPERYEHFLADAWRRLLLAGQHD